MLLITLFFFQILVRSGDTFKTFLKNFSHIYFAAFFQQNTSFELVDLHNGFPYIFKVKSFLFLFFFLFTMWLIHNWDFEHERKIFAISLNNEMKTEPVAMWLRHVAPCFAPATRFHALPKSLLLVLFPHFEASFSFYRTCYSLFRAWHRLPCLASVSVGFPVRSRHFSLFGGAEIGASATLMLAPIIAPSKREKCFKPAKSPILGKRLSRRLGTGLILVFLRLTWLYVLVSTSD